MKKFTVLLSNNEVLFEGNYINTKSKSENYELIEVECKDVPKIKNTLTGQILKPYKKEKGNLITNWELA